MVLKIQDHYFPESAGQDWLFFIHNIIIRLKEKGWSGDDIIAFLAFIETHNPSEEEAKKAISLKES